MKANKRIVLLLCTLLSFSLFASDEEIERELRLAAGIDDVETIARLLDQGADVNSANNVGKTAWMMAIENNNMEATALLLARGADVNASKATEQQWTQGI